MVRFRLFFRDGNLPQENKPLPKEPDERKKTKTPKSKVLSLYDISQCFVSEVLWVGTIVYYDKNLSYCSLFYIYYRMYDYRYSHDNMLIVINWNWGKNRKIMKHISNIFSDLGEFSPL